MSSSRTKRLIYLSLFDKPCPQSQDQGHGVGEGYQQPITFRSGSRQVSMSVKEVSFYFLSGEPIPYNGLIPIDRYILSTPRLAVPYSCQTEGVL